MAEKKGFPTFAIIVLILALLWLLSETGILALNIPWIPLILVIVALGWIIDHYTKN
jgi:hypothetical protein